MTAPPSDYLTGMTRHIVEMRPEKFGVLGAYSREMLRAEASEDYAFVLDQLAFRLTTLVMCGQTVSEHPEVTLRYQVQASPWHHFKHSFDWWVSNKNEWWEGRTPDGGQTTPAPWLVLLWPLLVLFPRWLRKHPVKYKSEIAKTTVNFRQSVLYPETDYVPPEFGRPVIYETMDVGAGFGLVTGSSRYMNRHEIASAFYRDPEVNRYISSPNYGPDAVLRWLERQGVNVDQLVKRR